jgi:hypothetical protein
MAKTKKKRRRKHRGTQGGRVDTRPSRTRPRSRAEAKAQAAQRRGSAKKGSSKGGRQDRPLAPPTWKGSFGKGALAAVLFFALFALIFKRPLGASAAISVFMLGFYVPMSYYVDSFMFKRRMRALSRPKPEPKPEPKDEAE